MCAPCANQDEDDVYDDGKRGGSPAGRKSSPPLFFFSINKEEEDGEEERDSWCSSPSRAQWRSIMSYTHTHTPPFNIPLLNPHVCVCVCVVALRWSHNPPLCARNTL